MIKHDTKELLPKPNQYVLAHLNRDNRGDPDDLSGGRYWVVVKFIKGISEDERAALDDNDVRKRTYRAGDVFGNNTAPYAWEEFGPSTYFGQEVDFWCELPTMENK